MSSPYNNANITQNEYTTYGISMYLYNIASTFFIFLTAGNPKKGLLQRMQNMAERGAEI